MLLPLCMLLATPAVAQLTTAPPPADPSGRTSLPPGQGTEAELRDRTDTDRVRDAVRASQQGSPAANRLLGQQFARCTVDRDAAGAHNVVTQMLGRDEVRSQHRNLLHHRCFGAGAAQQDIGRMAFPFPTLHVILADALVRRDYTTPGPIDFASVPSQVRSERITPATAEQLADMSEREREGRRESDTAMATWYIMERLGECTARRMPEHVRQLAQTDVASPEERAAIQGLQPALGACLPPGTTIRLRPADVRGASVLGYYRLARAAAASPQGTP